MSHQKKRLRSSNSTAKLQSRQRQRQRHRQCEMDASAVIPDLCEDSSTSQEPAPTTAVRRNGAEEDSVFHAVPREILQYILRFVPRSSWRAARLVCHRWNKAGEGAFDQFRTSQSFLYGVLLDPTHLSRLLEHPRFPTELLSDVSTMAVVFGTLKEPLMLRDLARRAVVTRECWFACFQRAVDKSNLAGVGCLLGPHHAAIVTSNIDLIAQIVCAKQHAATLQLVMQQCAQPLAGLLRSTNLVDWCIINCYTVTLSELLRVPVFCTRANLRRVLSYALVHHLEPLALAVWRIHPGGLDARREGSRSLFKACAHGWLPLATLLLKRGLSPAVGHQQEALVYASSYGHESIVQLLVADRRTLPGYNHNECVRRALQAGHVSVTMTLLLADNRIDPNDDDDEAALNLLCFALRMERSSHIGEHDAIVRLLLAMGVDPNRHGHAALQIALRRRNTSALFLLMQRPELEMTRDEFFEVLAEFPLENHGHRGVLQDVMQSARFRQHYA